MKTLLTLIAAAWLALAPVAQASHVALPLTLGEETSIRLASFCSSEGDAVSVLEEMVLNGRAASIKVFEIYLSTGACVNIPATFTPVEVIVRFENAAVIKVSGKDTEKFLYLLISNVIINGQSV